MADAHLAPLWDAECLKSLESELGADVIKELIPSFLDSLGTYLRGIEKAYSDSDGAGLKANAHALKSSCAALGALRFRDICAELERPDTQQNRDRLTQLVNEMKANEAPLRDKLKGHLAAL